MEKNSELSTLLEPVIATSREASEKILDIYAQDFRVDVKSDNSPLTEADMASHHCLVAGLDKLQPKFPILSEESSEISYTERKSWDYYWLIDPLDGTKEFIKRNGEFTVNVALIHENKPVLGVVYVPVTDECYFGATGHGAFKQTGNTESKPIAVRHQVPEPLTVVGSRSHKTGDLADYLARLGQHELKSVGSSLKFCLVAEGEADLYPRMGPTCEWDTAAAQCVVEQAGGRVTEIDGRPLQYNTKESYLNPYFLVFGDKTKDWSQYAG